MMFLHDYLVACEISSVRTLALRFHDNFTYISQYIMNYTCMPLSMCVI